MTSPDSRTRLGRVEAGSDDLLDGDHSNHNDLVDVSERATLGALLLAPRETADRILKMLADGDFRDPRCRFVFSIIRAMHDAHEPVDRLTVSVHVQRRGLLRAGEPRINLDSWIDDVCRLAPVPSSGTWYAGAVLEASARRTVLGVAEHLVLAAESGSVEDLAAVVERGLTTAKAAVVRAEVSR